MSIDPLSIELDEETAKKESETLRSILPAYDLQPEIPELLDLRQIHFPDNQNILSYSKTLHSQYVLTSLIQTMPLEDEK